MLTCRDCGAQSNYWRPGARCPHCGGSHLRRLTQARVNHELHAYDLLFATEGEPSQPQLKRFREHWRDSHAAAAQKEADAEQQRQGKAKLHYVDKNELFPG